MRERKGAINRCKHLVKEIATEERKHKGREEKNRQRNKITDKDERKM